MLRIRMTEEDRALLDAAAGMEGLDTSTWARLSLVRIAKRRAPTIVAEWTRRTGQRRSPDLLTD